MKAVYSVVIATLAGIIALAGSSQALAFIASPSLTGARINGVLPGSPAQRLGLEVGDVIVAIDNQPVRSQAEFHQLLANRNRVLLVVRDSRTGRFVQSEAYPRNGR